MADKKQDSGLSGGGSVQAPAGKSPHQAEAGLSAMIITS